MRFRTAVVLVLGALALVAAGCGGEEVAPVPEDVEGPVPTEEAPTETDGAEPGEGDPDAGEAVFAEGGCGGCHTYERAGATGTVAPNFDEVDTSFDVAVDVITNGRGGMPAFGDRFTDQQIRDVAAFVSDS